MEAPESEDVGNGRIAQMWEILDTRREGEIDFKGLKKGFTKMDHPLKNADFMLRDLLRTVDTSGDGRIQYEEFRVFVDHADKALRQLFESIDRDHNGAIDKDELRAAFANAGIIISNAKFDEFFERMDTNHDGVISYNEWRCELLGAFPLMNADRMNVTSLNETDKLFIVNFLLFLPAESPNLRTVLSYYSATGNLNPEGDVSINQLEGLGTDLFLLLHHFLHAVRSFLRSVFQLPVLSANIAPRPGLVSAGEASKPESLSGADLLYFDGDIEVEMLALPRSVVMWLLYRSYKQKLTENTPNLGYFFAGGLAGAISRTATAPLDRLKVYLIAQTGVKEEALKAAKEGSPLHAVSRGFRSLIDATKELWRAGGVRSLFAGNGLNVVKIMPESAIKFGAYEASKRAFARLEGHNDTKRLNPTSQFLSGGFGGMVSQCFVYPLDTLKFRMQCEVVEGGLQGNRLILETAKKMWQTNGVLSYFRGLPLGLIGMFPYAAIDLSMFEYLKAKLLARKARLHRCHEDDVPLSNFTTGAIGAFSGALGASAVYPLNVLRTRMQAQGTVLHPPTYNGILDVVRKTIKAEGVRGFYKGITPNLLKVAPAVSISYVVYENAKRALGLK